MQIYSDFQTSVKKSLTEIDKDWEKYNALIICGTHTPHETELLISKIEEARENDIPFLGICWGAQLAVIEYARNVLNIKDATSEEWGKGKFVIKKRKELKVGLHEGESWWSNYEPVIDYKFPDNFVCTFYHPEYQSSIKNKHKDLIKFLNICKKNNGNVGLHQV